ncbi:MAG: alkylation response protein AidB-like acyl-CoA dehydrogenase [Candidatus Aldehydirespiratoraceae bacterium]|jgi:alkylation response protein AidB-like acyl-CoA dehydrogenase
MDLTLSAEEQAFASDVGAWLVAQVDRPATFASIEDEIAWGREWQATMAANRMVAISWPEAVGGRGASPVEVALYNMEYARAGAPQPVNRVGINLAGPTLLACGTEEQQARWLPAILDASEIWCQLFSEPDAGSDLASLRTRGVRVDDGWIVSGQKVWTSYAQFAKWGIALVRTDPDAKKHAGITYMVIDMESPGIEIRPLHQITDESEFNEVFLEEVFVPDDQIVGGLHHGWSVANTTLAHERGTNFPFKEQVVHEVYLDELVALAARRGLLDDPLIADDIADAFVQLRLLRLQNWRTLSALGRGVEPGPESSIVKLTWSEMTQHLSALALRILGDEAVLWPAPNGDSAAGTWQRQWLWSKSASIAGGTSEVQRTIIAERILGLPRG